MNHTEQENTVNVDKVLSVHWSNDRLASPNALDESILGTFKMMKTINLILLQLEKHQNFRKNFNWRENEMNFLASFTPWRTAIKVANSNGKYFREEFALLSITNFLCGSQTDSKQLLSFDSTTSRMKIDSRHQRNQNGISISILYEWIFSPLSARKIGAWNASTWVMVNSRRNELVLSLVPNKEGHVNEWNRRGALSFPETELHT